MQLLQLTFWQHFLFEFFKAQFATSYFVWACRSLKLALFILESLAFLELVCGKVPNLYWT
jgi:hypothetical protein